MGALGIPDSYTAQIWWSNASYTDIPPLVREVDASNIKWQRIANDASAAEVTVPRSSLKMGESHFYPRAWLHCLVILRNGYKVWKGPILSWTRNDDGDLTIHAKDGAVGMQRTYIGANRNFIDEEVSQVVTQVLIDAKVGVAGSAPYPITIGRFYPLGFYPVSAGPTGVLDAVVTRKLDYLQFEHVSDVLREFAADARLFFTCVNDYLYLNEAGVRQQLAVGDVGWPKLTDDNVLGFPAVSLDGLNVANTVVRPTAVDEQTFVDLATDRVYENINNLGDPEFPGNRAVAPFDYFDNLVGSRGGNVGVGMPAGMDPNPSTYLGDLRLFVRATDDTPSLDSSDPLHTKETFGAYGAPNLTVEQVRLAPSFSHPSLAADLSNLLPGTRFEIGFSDRSMFDQPIVERKIGIRPTTLKPGVNPDSIPLTVPAWDLVGGAEDYGVGNDANQVFEAMFYWDWAMCSLWASRCDHLRLVQLDVEVQISNDGIEESVLASFTATVQYVLEARDGTGVIEGGTGGDDNYPIPARPRFVG